MIYLDYNATAPYSPSVKCFISEQMSEMWANPSSEYPISVELSEKISQVRNSLAEYLNCSSKSLVFTSGATESINTVLSLETLKKLGVETIISSLMEHHATLDRLKFLKANGIDVSFISNDINGNLNLSEFQNLVGPKTLSSFLFANNETGVINPIQEMTKISHQAGGLFHTDAVQGFGKIKIDLEALDVDFASFSGHKIGSLKGIGFHFARDIRKIHPLLQGGSQERGLRPGTINFAGIWTLGLALSDLSINDIEKVIELKNNLEKSLVEQFGFKINCFETNRLPNTVSVRMPGKVAREVLFSLARLGICVSTGSACTSGSFEPSHVMKSLGFDRETAGSCLRISLGPLNSNEDIEILINKLKGLYGN